MHKKNNLFGLSQTILIITVAVLLIGLGIWLINKNSQQQVSQPAANSALPSVVTNRNDAANGTTGQEEQNAGEVKTFVLTGRNFSFSQKEIRVREGDRVRIEFTSTDGFHDWVVDEFSAATSRVNTGGSTSVEFVADKKGTFEYYCSVGQHRALGMKGKLIVE